MEYLLVSLFGLLYLPFCFLCRLFFRQLCLNFAFFLYNIFGHICLCLTLYVHLSFLLPIYYPAYLLFYLAILLPIYSSTYLFFYLSILLPIYSSTYFSPSLSFSRNQSNRRPKNFLIENNPKTLRTGAVTVARIENHRIDDRQ